MASDTWMEKYHERVTFRASSITILVCSHLCMRFIVHISCRITYRFHMKQFRGNLHKLFLLHTNDIINKVWLFPLLSMA